MKEDVLLKANHCVSCMSVKKKDLGTLNDSAGSPERSIVHCLPERRGEKNCAYSFSLPLRHSSTSLYPSSSLNNAADFIIIPSTSSFTQELLWSDIPRTPFLHKASLLLHWMATNLRQNTKSGNRELQRAKGHGDYESDLVTLQVRKMRLRVVKSLNPSFTLR